MKEYQTKIHPSSQSFAFIILAGLEKRDYDCELHFIFRKTGDVERKFIFQYLKW